MTINPNMFPKRLIPNAVRRKATTEQKATVRIRTMPESIAEIGTISTGLGSTANDVSPFPDCGRAVARRAQEVLRKRRLQARLEQLA